MRGAELEPIDSAPRKRPGVLDVPGEDQRSFRNLQRMGPVSLGVSVPRSWVETHGLHVGSPVRLRVTPDGALQVRPPSGETEGRRATFEADPRRPPEHLLRSLLGAYLTGVVSFEVRQPGGLSPEVRAIARTFVRRTIQPEVLSEERDRLELRDVSDVSSVPLLKLLGRMGQLVLALHRDAGDRWGALPTGDRPSWEARDDEVDRQAWYIERSAVRRLDGEPIGERPAEAGLGPLGSWLVARNLERIADHAVRIGEAGAHLAPGTVSAQQQHSVRQFHEQALAHLAAVLEDLNDGSGAHANELLDTGEALHQVARALTERLLPATGGSSYLPPGTAFALGTIVESIDRTVAYTQDIAEVTLGVGSHLFAPRAGGAPSEPGEGLRHKTERTKTGEKKT